MHPYGEPRSKLWIKGNKEADSLAKKAIDRREPPFSVFTTYGPPFILMSDYKPKAKALAMNAKLVGQWDYRRTLSEHLAKARRTKWLIQERPKKDAHSLIAKWDHVDLPLSTLAWKYWDRKLLGTKKTKSNLTKGSP